MTGTGLLQPALRDCRTVADVLAVVAGAAGEPGARGDWIVTNPGWHESQLAEGRLPTRWELDSASPERPVFLGRGGHNVVLNTAAMRRLGLADDAVAPDGATYVRDERGLTGQIIGVVHIGALSSRLPDPRPGFDADAIRTAQRRYAEAGIVSVLDPGLTLPQIETYRELDRAGELRLRVGMLWRAPQAGSSVEDALELLGSGELKPEHRSDARLRFLGVKIGVDGGVETGFYREPYRRQDDPSHACGKAIHTAEEVVAICRAANRAGLPVGAHAVGDAGIDLALRAFAAADADSPIRDNRWTLIHMMYPRPDHWEIANRLGVGVTAQQPLLYALGGGFVDYIGERAQDIEPLAEYLRRSDLPVGGGSDSPVAPYAPLLGIASSVTRSTRSAGVLGPQWAISPEQALDMYTRGSAWSTFEDHLAGTLTPGKLADLVVLDGDPAGVDPTEIDSLGVRMTVASGAVVHDSTP
ncbi:MAG: amidohydrolase family protein, partial [Nonomuraea sp.]|nr:amidohydrolase family protein [Nonomuraea sp.]